MAKNDLSSKGMWEAYSNEVQKRMKDPKFFGKLTKEDSEKSGLKLVDVVHGSESCGDAVELYLLVEEDTGIIKDSRFQSFGCGTAIAASDMMAELCIGKTIDDAIKITNLEVERALRDDPDTPAVPGQKMHCSVMAYDVIKKAVASYKNIDVSEFEDKEIVCHCAMTTRKEIEEAIISKNLTTVEEIVKETGAGSYCGSCIRPGGHEEKNIYLVDILDDVLNRKKSKEKEIVVPKCIPFDKLTIPLKLRAIETALDKDVRPALANDGGGVDVMDLQGSDLYISYTGHCVGCKGALHGTLDFMKRVLREKVDASINVLPYSN